MFANAIRLVGGFTRPLLTISRAYGSSNIHPGSATLFFVNDEGCAITCKHIAQLLLASNEINQTYAAFQKERSALPDDLHHKAALAKLEEKYGYHPNSTVACKHTFCDCVEPFSSIDYILHPKYDLAILRFHGFHRLQYSGYAVFARDGSSAAPGDFLCRLGYPFPEYTGFFYDSTTDNIGWTPNGNLSTPRFPIEGMLTRYLLGENGETMGYELSTPGLRGQSGGPLFNQDGLIYGMQSRTKHLHLGFDIALHLKNEQGAEQHITNQPFLHVGECIHVDIIKKFLQENHIRYYVGDSPETAVPVE